MLEKNYILKSGLFLFLACLFLMPSIYAQAAVKKLDILNGENRKSCQVDLDGDGVKEKLKLAVKYDEYGCIENASVYVNGKKALVIKSPYDYSVGADNLKCQVLIFLSAFIRLGQATYMDQIIFTGMTHPGKSW